MFNQLNSTSPSNMKKSIAKTNALKEVEIAKLQKAKDIIKSKSLVAETDLENKKLKNTLDQQKLLKVAPELDEIKRLNKNKANKIVAGKTNQVIRAPFLGPEFDEQYILTTTNLILERCAFSC